VTATEMECGGAYCPRSAAPATSRAVLSPPTCPPGRWGNPALRSAYNIVDTAAAWWPLCPTKRVFSALGLGTLGLLLGDGDETERGGASFPRGGFSVPASPLT
jgi:hypothetical protein